jgi:hypothetical protein
MTEKLSKRLQEYADDPSCVTAPADCGVFAEFAREAAELERDRERLSFVLSNGPVDLVCATHCWCVETRDEIDEAMAEERDND